MAYLDVYFDSASPPRLCLRRDTGVVTAIARAYIGPPANWPRLVSNGDCEIGRIIGGLNDVQPVLAYKAGGVIHVYVPNDSDWSDSGGSGYNQLFRSGYNLVVDNLVPGYAPRSIFRG